MVYFEDTQINSSMIFKLSLYPDMEESNEKNSFDNYDAFIILFW